jgi:outer membrane protein, heavy metal efflux system
MGSIMALVQTAGYCARLAIPLLLAAGCGQLKPAVCQSAPSEVPRAASQPTTAMADQCVQGRDESPVRQVVHQLPAVASSEIGQDDGLFSEQAELSLPELMREVEARNPSIQAMAYAWRAASQRYPQAVSLDDPMFMTMVAPASFGSNQVQPAYILSGSQKLPWFGKRDIRGSAAQSEANAAFHDMNDTRLQVAQVTRVAFYDYYVAVREAELIGQNSQVMSEFRRAAQQKYENNQVTLQDVLQADVELADTERRSIEIERMRRVARARLNTLLRRNPTALLPPPPRTLKLDAESPPISNLQQMATIQRPDLAALAARVRAEEAAVNLAIKQYYPDAEFFGRYDSFWQPASTQSDLRAQVGMNMNVPLYRKKLQAAVCEAQFRLSQRRAEYQQRQLDIQYEVQSAYEQVEESRQTAELYKRKYLPFAEQNLRVARSNYDVGQINFLFLAQAQRQLIDVREKYQQTLADYHRRMAELERVVGGNVLSATHGEELSRPTTR